jgi:regulator of protease activity HflC (stomatin/prohibitin superfamily)
MSHRPPLRDLISTLIYSLWHDEQVRAVLRLLVVIATVIALGLIGNAIVQRLPPPADRYFDRQQGCAYNAESVEAQTSNNQTAPPGLAVYAQWYIRNTGSCAWGEDVQFRMISGSVQVITDTLSVPAYNFPTAQLSIPPLGTFAPVVQMIAPSQPGTYVTTWRLFTPKNDRFGPEFTFTVEVLPEAQMAAPAAPKYYIDWWFVVPAIVGIVIALMRAGQFVAQMYSLKAARHGIAFVANTTFGLPVGSGSMGVHHSQIEGDPSDDHEILMRIGGPGVLLVKENTAVLTERGARYSRVLGPEGHTLKPFERIRMIYDLRPQTMTGNEIGVTKDGIPVRAPVITLFRFMRRMPNEPPSAPSHARFLSVLSHFIRNTPPGSVTEPPVSPEALRQALYEVHVNPPNKIKWTNTAHGAAAGAVREEIGNRRLDELFLPDDPERNPRREIADQLQQAGRGALAGRGIELVDSGFANLQVPRDVTLQRRDTWQVTWDKESNITLSTGEAEGYLQTQLARAEAQAELIQAVTQAIRTMNQTSQEGAPINPLALRYMDAIATMVDRTLRESSRDANSRKEMEKMLDRLRKTMTSSSTKPSQ